MAKSMFVLMNVYYSLVSALQSSFTLDKGDLKDPPGLIRNFIVVPEHKLLFCYMEKVGCTNFNDLFRFLRAKYDPSQAKGKTWRRNGPEQHNLSVHDMHKLLKNPEWHKAVFYRDPIERFVAAYNSKCLMADSDGEAHCEREFHKKTLPFGEAVASFNRDDEMGRDEKNHDYHFRLQGDFCLGLRDTLHHYDTVEELNRDTANQKVTRLLQKVGVNASHIPHFAELFPPPEDNAWKTDKHNTGSSTDMSTYFPSNASQRFNILYKHYAPDYGLFEIPKPAWVTHDLLELPSSVESKWPVTDVFLPIGIDNAD